jgi:hypothetical protein
MPQRDKYVLYYFLRVGARVELAISQGVEALPVALIDFSEGPFVSGF